MPSIKRQRTHDTSSNGQPPAPPGSLLARGAPVSDLLERLRQTVLIYGLNRIGKTTLACQWQKPLALISFEPNPLSGGGAVSVAKVEGVTHYVVIPSTARDLFAGLKITPLVGIEEALQLCVELRDSGFKSVVLDGATSIQDVCLTELMNLPELPSQLRVAQTKGDTSWGVVPDGVYQERSAKSKEVLRKFLNLPQSVIITAKERDHNPPKDDKGWVQRNKLTRGLTLESFIAADLGQATAEWLMDACDCICRLYLAKETKTQTFKVGVEEIVQEVETGREVRRLLTKLHANFAAGIRFPTDFRKSGEVPDFIEGATPAELHKKLMTILS